MSYRIMTVTYIIAEWELCNCYYLQNKIAFYALDLGFKKKPLLSLINQTKALNTLDS